MQDARLSTANPTEGQESKFYSIVSPSNSEVQEMVIEGNVRNIFTKSESFIDCQRSNNHDSVTTCTTILHLCIQISNSDN